VSTPSPALSHRVRGEDAAAPLVPLTGAVGARIVYAILSKGDSPMYVDGFVLPVPKKSIAAYRAIARKAGKVWLEYGALSYVECVGDDVKKGKVTSFPQSVKLKPNETVVFSWITYKSKADRDRINKKVMKDPRIAAMGPEAMPFDGKRMFWGGFKPVVEL
jgi:uncharacterized protein YbaA (DUF1428 family)